MLSTFRLSKSSKRAKSNSLSSGKTQWSSGLFELLCLSNRSSNLLLTL